MKTKKEIVDNWLVRYTGVDLNDFGKYILLTNFQHYVDLFAELTGAEVQGRDKSMSMSKTCIIYTNNVCRDKINSV